MASQYKLSAILQGHELDVRAIIAPTNDLLVSAARDKTVRSWTRQAPNAFSQDKTYLGHNHFVNALAFISASAEHPNAFIAEEWETFVSFFPWLAAVIINYVRRSRTGLIVSSGSDKTINIYEPDFPADPIFSLIGHKENVCTLAISPSGHVVSGSWDKYVFMDRRWQLP
ncbi:LOW QUALITY PROTEIN: WD40-repeat-containing domain protein [Jimgerdemannia flammicorona]|uniref:WD40-repeat-containing domain protein n=1 Tax=Jimgerdemannia flammicorona TaxID=994334 RepID=A0A433DLY0_9FUNG|nr:LOW QUALITY PROTEIN: WD40-repeat-containing domain protein [Jimgerdemannia flammicorona]